MDAASPETAALIGEAPAFVAMLEHVSQAAPLRKPVLVVGERGTGKELISSRLHYLSERWDETLIKVNCAALTETLLETELFGHEAGAFTGATRTHVGRFEQADGGTLVLDELGTIPLRMQEKILRVIEYGEFRRVGGKETRTTDVRIVGATNEDLPSLAASGRFRADLLDRLAFDVIHIPPLRERIEDIPTFAYHFGVNMTSELKRPLFSGFTPEAAGALLRHGWPGNVRELKNTVERSVYRCEDPDKPIARIYFDPFDSPYAPPPRAVPEPPRQPDAARAARPAEPDPPLPDDFRAAVDAYERGILSRALEAAHYKQTAAAQLIGLTYHQLRGLLKKHELSGPRDARSAASEEA